MDSQMNLMNCSLEDNLTFNAGTTTGGTNDLVYRQSMSAWEYWQNIYYPTTITTSYPVYIRDRAEDKGKQAFEIIKMLQDKRFMDLKTVRDFIDAMDLLIKTL